MNLKSTLFILDAGASKPYGYPTAEELSDTLIRNYEEIILSNAELIPELREHHEKHSKDIKILMEQFSLAHANSIDLFLTRNQGKVFQRFKI